MLLANCPNFSSPVRRFCIADMDGDFPAHFTGKTWNGYDCPVFNPEQVEEFLAVLNESEDFEAQLIDDVVIVNIFSSGESVRIENMNGAYQFHGWCFCVV